MFEGTMLMVILVCVAVVVLFKLGYVKAPPDVAYIISGISKEPRVVIGKATLKIPFLERLDKLSLRLIKVDVKTNSSVPTKEFININVDSVVMAKIPSNNEMIQLAAKNFLNVDEETISAAIQDVLEGNTREIVGSMNLREMISNRKAFAEKVQENAVPDLAKLGIELISFTVQSFNDKNGVIEDLGIENTAQIKKSASIAKAEADRDVAIAQAEAGRQAAEAQAQADQQVAEKNNEVLVRKAELKIVSDSKKAEADAAYKIQEQNQRKTIDVAAVNANIATEERNVELMQRRANVREKQLDAEMKKQADADLYRRQREADAEKYEKEKEAAAALALKQAEADAIRYTAEKEAEAIRLKGEAEANALALKGQAEADALLAKGKAEAEAMQKKADAYKQYTNAAMLEMMIKVLPEVAREVAAPLSQIDKITIIGGGENGNNLGVANNVPQAMAYAFNAMQEATGIDMREIVKANGYDAKVTKNINIKADEALVDIAKEIIPASTEIDTAEEAK